ncbi:protein Kri1p [[Candida] railenensis]|uniref:Protein Kri1p n=1 Tax=[Candida] railenensis TaxID=45579 RepID=A0A9P0QS77_9ASCO|nr:protein Kri1p [[Candida] railenensis]
MARKKSAAKKAREAAEQSDKPEITKNVEKTAEAPQRVQEQEYSESESGSSDESEDEYGELITEGIENGINEVLNAIKTNPKSLLDPNVKFFNDPIAVGGEKVKGKEDKPIYLKDYHRMNLLSGDYKNDVEDEDNEFGTVDGEKPFVVTEREDRNKLLSDIKNAFNDDEGDDDSDDGFLKKKVAKTRRELLDESTGSLPDPNKDENEFLSAFVDKKAWIPKENDKVINLDRVEDEDDEDFDDAVEQFEHAYNFRYEDPNAAEIVSYARNQATLRRSATNSRKRQREKENEEREQAEKEKQEHLKKKKISKVNEVADRLKKIKEAVGDEVPDEVIEKVFGNSLLNDDFDDTDWDSKMAQIFDEQYYEVEVAKPEWSDNEEDVEVGEEEMDAEPPVKKSKKDKLKDKKTAKKEKESIKEKAQEIVEANTLRLLGEVVEERGRSKKKDVDAEVKFKYREVSPEAFGLTTRDIILADDKQLNEFIGLKKFAPYRAKELRMKDKRKYTKSKHLKEWRKETFGKSRKAPEEVEGDGSIWVPVEGGEDVGRSSKKDKKDKKHKKSKK